MKPFTPSAAAMSRMASDDEVEQRKVWSPTNEADLSQSSIPSLAQRRRDPRSLEPIVRRTEYNHWVAPLFHSTPDISTIFQVGAVAGPRVHLHNWGIDRAVCSQHMRRKTYIQTSRYGLPPSRAQDRGRSIRSWVLVEAW